MKSKKKKAKSSFISETRNFLSLLETGAIYAFLFCMLAIFPLYFENAYNGMGDVKYNLFAKSSGIFLAVELCIIIVRLCLYICEYFKGENIEYLIDEIKERSFLDIAVGIYGVCVIISFLVCQDKEFALKGAAGWNMGLYSQLVFVGIYFIISWKKQWLDSLLQFHLVSSGAVFLLGILHRFQIDPLGMYIGLDDYYKRWFISTVGQTTWYSSYMCTVFIIGIIIFFLSKNTKTLVLTGVYTVLCFATFVTQNSDSAYIAIGGIYLLLAYFSLKDKERFLRFLQLIIIMLSTFVTVGLLQKIFANRAIELDFISVFLSQNIVIWIVLILSIGIYILFRKLEIETFQKILKVIKKYYILIPIFLFVGIIGMALFIYLNTSGFLLEKFGKLPEV